jgi:hypothetical protein
MAGLGGEGGVLGIDPTQYGIGLGGAGGEETDLDRRRTDARDGRVDDLKDEKTECVDERGEEDEAEEGPRGDAALAA